jgi:hypothetical protein
MVVAAIDPGTIWAQARAEGVYSVNCRKNSFLGNYFLPPKRYVLVAPRLVSKPIIGDVARFGEKLATVAKENYIDQ